MDKQRYFENGRLKRGSIAMDIKYHKISHDELMSLISDPEVSKEFFGEPCGKIPKEDWDQQYLDKLSLAAVSECFNKDYLLYLEQVANGVGGKKRSTKLIVGGAAIVIAAAVALLVIMKVSSPREDSNIRGESYYGESR